MNTYLNVSLWYLKMIEFKKTYVTALYDPNTTRLYEALQHQYASRIRHTSEINLKSDVFLVLRETQKLLC